MHNREPYYEEHYACGMIYYGEKCKKCGDLEYAPPGLLELGVYK